ncbi:hemolysin family protein [Ruminococcus flavefaciens]|uniref:hemolysin family protein n=1 Tax=Ruminococcus flavefaciens TaxID=1265 RepID=UPI0026EA0B5F|nr:hemolysin family protein [Ruminococcus flavefaciens]MDD7515096.1 hemolysin family protein [Ruminococcus flavefaciens]MDY5692646.1 hemolysin family protein [Ruminococcus flavefaciens]
MLGQIILQIILIALNALFACTEVAVISTSDVRLEKLAASGNKKAVRLKKLTDSPTRFLATIQVAITLAGFIGAAFAADSFSEYLTSAISKTGIGIPAAVIKKVSVILITLILSYFTLVFGELVPKRFAMKDPEKIALAMSGTISFVAKIFAPLVWLLNASANGILRLIGIDPESEDDTVTEEEILMMSDAGAEKGTIDEDENRIIKNVFAFDDMTAEQVCTHRTDVDVLWSSDDTSVWEETIHRTRHSSFPICGESVDNVIGVLNAKDYFRLDDKSRDNIMAKAVREPCFVHESMKADRLFDQMKQRGADHFAIVVDEYGGMSGIITITDLVEELVGDFADDPEDEPAVRLEQTGENIWTVPGMTSLSDVCDELEVTLPADKYETFGGYIIAELGEIPKDGTQLTLDSGGLHIEVLEVKHHRIEVCRVKKLPPAEEKEKDEE